MKITSRTVVQQGIELPWVHYKIEHDWKSKSYRMWCAWPPESGTVFVSLDTLYELSEQGRWDSQFGEAFIPMYSLSRIKDLGMHEGLALEQAGLAEQETKGGFHRTDKLKDVIKQVEESDAYQALQDSGGQKSG